MHKPSDYAHRYDEKPKTNWNPPAVEETEDPQPKKNTELATFRLLYESSRLCVFETRDGHLTAVDVNRLV